MAVVSEPPELPTYLAKVAETNPGETNKDFAHVQNFLLRFGYLTEDAKEATGAERVYDGPESARMSGILDSATSTALARYQHFNGLPVTGRFDAPTRDMMTRPRCGLPDTAAISVRFRPVCSWSKTWLTYAFGTGTSDIIGDEERQAVRNAFATWSAAAPLAFRELQPNQDSDVLIQWGNAACGDTDMTGGIAAHADYPPGCGKYGNARPRPLHFNDQEWTWVVGAKPNSVDVESAALHEIGHILGLDHSGVQGAVMAAGSIVPNMTRRELTNDDIEGIRKLYPPRGPIFVKHSGKCLDSEGHSTANGADIVQNDYWGGQNQIIRIEWVEAGFYKLSPEHRSVAEGKVLDIRGGNTANRAELTQFWWLGLDHQRFGLNPVGHGYYAIVNKTSGRVLDVLDRSQSNNANVVQFDWWGGDNQRWRIGPAPITSRNSGKVLDVKDISLIAGAPVIQWPYWGGSNQRMRLDYVGGPGPVYRIMIEHSGMCLTVEHASKTQGARVVQWPYNGTGNQHWRAESVRDGYIRLVASHSGMCLDVLGISADNGAQLIQWPYWGGANQMWRL